MSLRTYADGTVANVPDITCANCHKSLSFNPPPEEVKYWFAFCSAECCTSFFEQKKGKALGV